MVQSARAKEKLVRVEHVDGEMMKVVSRSTMESMARGKAREGESTLA